MSPPSGRWDMESIVFKKAVYLDVEMGGYQPGVHLGYDFTDFAGPREMGPMQERGLVCSWLGLLDGVVLGADTRATEGPIVADKNCEKIHYMAPNIYCCGAGTAADTEAVTGSFSPLLALLLCTCTPTPYFYR
ncbi:hypothetical protein Taro_043845 [Colocasia esculenta]|uniref:Uncharacterized protein n=1 Tax=Colocasia esculenta TaxID=4460 RepID=A0A843WSF1_COLES|nr:hypothetical protein [Colocasia esculenta]